jgi:hypothetical protein
MGILLVAEEMLHNWQKSQFSQEGGTGMYGPPSAQLQLPVNSKREETSSSCFCSVYSGAARHPDDENYLLSSTTRSYSGCVGRASCWYNFANFSISSPVTVTGCFSTNQVTFSLQGGVVSGPENV